MEAAIAVALVNGTNNVVCLLHDSVLMMVCKTVDIVSYSIPEPQKYCFQLFSHSLPCTV